MDGEGGQRDVGVRYKVELSLTKMLEYLPYK